MGVNMDGIIFGGMVRDEIIATHYKSLFDEHHSELDKRNYNKYWNMNYHVETVKRTIIPNDMDIYFQDNEKAEMFIQTIQTYARSFNGTVIIADSMLYEFGENLIHKKIYMNLYIGRTVTFSGILNIVASLPNLKGQNECASEKLTIAILSKSLIFQFISGSLEIPVSIA
jgi:hypothetical protein